MGGRPHFQELGFGEGGFDFHSDSKLIRYDEVNGIETVVVRTDLLGPFDITFSPSDIPADLLPGGEAVDTAGMPGGGGELRYNGEFAIEGQSWVDPLTGDVLRGQAAGSMSMYFDFGELGSEIPQFGMEVDIDMESQRLI